MFNLPQGHPRGHFRGPSPPASLSDSISAGPVRQQRLSQLPVCSLYFLCCDAELHSPLIRNVYAQEQTAVWGCVISCNDTLADYVTTLGCLGAERASHYAKITQFAGGFVTTWSESWSETGHVGLTSLTLDFLPIFPSTSSRLDIKSCESELILFLLFFQAAPQTCKPTWYKVSDHH